MFFTSRIASPLMWLPACALTASPALAATQTFTDRASWEAAVTGQIVTETFASIPQQTLPSTGTTDFGSFVVETRNTGSDARVRNGSHSTAINGTRFFTAFADNAPTVKSTSFVFPNPLVGFGFDFRTEQPGDGTQLTFADQVTLDLKDGLRLTSGFVGFITDKSFDRVDFVSRHPSFSRTFLDNFSMVTPVPGDFNGDGDGDGRDFLVWQRGNSPTPLSQSDLADWQANYGQSPEAELQTASRAVAVPEPSTAGLLIVAGAVSLLSARRRQSAG
jgi:hypothetical protein